MADAPARFLLRLPGALHRTLGAAAAREHLSLHEYCVQRLSGPDLGVGARDQIAALLAHSAKVAGLHLLGVIAHGSWVRGEASTSSDIDVMVVVEPALPLTRGLYREWDQETPVLLGRTLDAPEVGVAGDPDHIHRDCAARAGLRQEFASDRLV